jgi:hypothetical protein
MPKGNAPNAATKKLYKICLSSNAKYCLAPSSRITQSDIYVLVGDGIALAALIFAIITNRQGRETPEDEGEVYKGKHEKGEFYHWCLGGRQSGTERAYMTTNCFGNNLTSWIPQSDNPAATRYDIYNYESALKHNGLSNLIETRRAANGAFVYNRDETSGYWSTWSYYRAGSCTGC